MKATVVAVALVLIAASACAGSSRRSGTDHPATSLATVRRGSLSEQTQFNGTLGYAGSYTVLGQARGTVTWLPRAGAVIGDGQVLYRVDQAPVVLLYGPVPAYRTLAEGATGADVAELNHDLVALGYLGRADVASGWDEFGWATAAGIEKLQQHLGVDQTGQLDLGDVVFLPAAARVASVRAVPGGPASGPVLTATSTARTVSVALDADLQSEVRVGDRVTITLPDNNVTHGTVASVGRVATTQPSSQGGPGSATPTVPVTIRPADLRAAGHLDQAPVLVSITNHTVRDVLAVPVTALLARASGGYAVEVVAGNGRRHLVPVTPGLFDDAAGLVQASGPGLAAGQRVVAGQ